MIRPVLPILAVILSGACTPEERIAFIEASFTQQVVLDDDTPSRHWSVHLESDEVADRSGPTWTTMRVEQLLAVDEADPWEDLWLDAWLTGDEVAEDHELFQEPGLYTMTLQENYQAQCVLGSPCGWDYDFVTERRTGTAQVATEVRFWALLTLGPEAEAPTGAQFSLVVEELED